MCVWLGSIPRLLGYKPTVLPTELLGPGRFMRKFYVTPLFGIKLLIIYVPLEQWLAGESAGRGRQGHES